jgi:PIN domain nuclease of toxin-antitoxin system
MRILLDPLVWLWMIADPDQLTDEAQQAFADTENELYLSAAGVWKIAMEHAAGRIKYSGSPAVQVPFHIKRSGVTLLPITADHALAAAALPMHHRDTFDRMMIAQATSEQLTLATANDSLSAYGVPLLNVRRSANP